MIAPHAERGLTLVEMLVVLAIVAIMAGATVMSIGGGGGDRTIRREATRLSTMLRLASDDVRLDERPLAFAWDARGYRFVTRDAKTGAQRADQVEQLGTPHVLPSGISLSVADAQSPVALTGDGSGVPIAAQLSEGKARWTIDYDGIDATAAARAVKIEVGWLPLLVRPERSRRTCRHPDQGTCFDFAQHERTIWSSDQGPGPCEQGFTLIEALVALLILAIASAGIIGAIETQVDTTRGLEQRAAALWVAENRLAELRLAGSAPVSGVGAVEMLGAPWQVTVTPRSSDDPDLRLVEVEVRRPSTAAPLVSLRGFVDAGTTTRR